MRTTPALRTLTAALFTGSALAAAPMAFADVQRGSGGSQSSVWGTVVSRTDLTLRQAPTTHSPSVGQASPGSEERVGCVVRGQSVNGNPYWYWLVESQAWATAAFVDTGGRSVPACDDPCPVWRNGSWTNWNDPYWGGSSGSSDPADTWTFSGSGSIDIDIDISGSWSWSVTGSSSDG
ncbi:SH3 domain-containing protein [Streptomyces sp. NPDC088387]|uniref:SH3 domain-containing protein n=1 Tax=Streptomyces sp. NPDC088387 TaxID=3365859 RepID=UPI0038118EE4